MKILEITLGALILATVAAAVFSSKLPRLHGKTSLLCFAALTGALSVAVTQADSAVIAYAQTTHWSQREFPASM